MNDTIHLQVRYTEAEFAAAARRHLLHTPALGARCALVAGLLALLALILATLLPSLASVWLLAGVGWLAALCYSIGYAAPRRRFRADPRHAETFHFQFSPAGVALSTTHINSQFRWSGFKRARADERFYLLSVSLSQLIIIPRRAFTTPAQEAAFVALLRRQLPCELDTRRLPASTVALDTYTPPAAPPDWR